VKKIRRELKRAVERTGATLLSIVDHRGHLRCTVQIGDAVHVVMSAGSPTNRDVTLRNFERDVWLLVEGRRG
jgi:hypothetical protein